MPDSRIETTFASSTHALELATRNWNNEIHPPPSTSKHNQILTELVDRLMSAPDSGETELMAQIGPKDGWKIHLNFDAASHSSLVEARLDEISRQLETDTEQELPFKIGNGGGVAHDAPGKEATVYAGSMQHLRRVAEQIENDEISEILLPPARSQLTDDIPVTGLESLIWARFSIGKSDLCLSLIQDFDSSPVQYLGSGIGSFRDIDKQFRVMGFKRDFDSEYAPSLERHSELFGPVFIGENGEFWDMLDNSFSYLRTMRAAYDAQIT